MVEQRIPKINYAICEDDPDGGRQNPRDGDLSPGPINCSTESFDWPDSCHRTWVVSLRYWVQKTGGGQVVGKGMREIREIYQSWLDGDLSQEDALFAIGDLLEKQEADRAPFEPVAERRPATRKQSS